MDNGTPDTETPHDNLRCIWTDGPYRCGNQAYTQMVGRTRPFVCERHEKSAATFIAHALHDDVRIPLEQEVERLRREWVALQKILRDENSVVYYLQRENGDIKIGVSRRLDARITELENEHGTLRLVALEYGGKTTERIRHKQFGHLWVVDEWFEGGAELLDHCYRIVKTSPALAPNPAPMVSAPA